MSAIEIAVIKPPHDMGGNKALTVVPDKPGEPIFKTEWHRRVLGLTVAVGAMGAWSVDASRFARESIPISDYKRYSYYERWLAGLINLLVQRGFVDETEIIAGHAVSSAPSLWRRRILKKDNVKSVLQEGTSSKRKASIPKFEIGQKVLVKRPSDTLIVKLGHTRLPHYIAGMVGKIILLHGSHVLPNSNAHFKGEKPEPLYSVVFLASDLWESSASLSDSVVVDCWESYLTSANVK